MRPPDLRAQAGFTLLELLLVIAIVGILASLGVSLYVGWRAGSLNHAAVAGAERAVAEAQQTAKRLSQDVSITFTKGSGTITVGTRTYQLPRGARADDDVSVTFSGIMGVQSPFQTQTVKFTTGSGALERTSTLSIIPPLALTAVAP